MSAILFWLSFLGEFNATRHVIVLCDVRVRNLAQLSNHQKTLVRAEKFFLEVSSLEGFAIILAYSQKQMAQMHVCRHGSRARDSGK